MAVSPRAACLTVGLLWAAPAAAQGDADADAPPAAAPAEAPSPTLPEHPDLDAAKAAYNEARYPGSETGGATPGFTLDHLRDLEGFRGHMESFDATKDDD